LDGANRGDKDVFVARLDGDGRLMWLRQAGSAGEDKGMAVAVSDGSVYLGGMMSGDGGVDGLLARYSTDGAPMWVKQLGTPHRMRCGHSPRILAAASTSPVTQQATSPEP
jgi:hypothetical protein